MAEAKGSAKPTTRRRHAAPPDPLADPAENGDESSSDKVATRICRAILAGRFVPGQKLVETSLAANLGLSRGPVREALKQLAAEGVVELTRHKGGYIRAMSRQEAIEFLEVVGALTELMVTRAAEAAAREVHSAEIREALQRITEVESSNHPRMAWIEPRESFYDTMIKVGGNAQLNGIFPRMRIHLLRLQAEPYLTRQDRADRVEEYIAVTKAVLAQDAARARREMRKHVRQMIARISRLPDEVFQSH